MLPAIGVAVRFRSGPVSSRAALLLPLVIAAAPGNGAPGKTITAGPPIARTPPFSFHASRSAPRRTGGGGFAPPQSYDRE
jgi:hypothetical protein